MSAHEDWDFASTTTSAAVSRQSGAGRPNDQKGFFGKADRDPLKLFIYGLEPNLEESGVRNLLVTADCPAPTSVAFKVKTVKEDRGDVQRAYAFVEFATRKDASTAFDELKKRDVKLNYAKLSATPSGIRSGVADFAFESFRKKYSSADSGTVSNLISRFETVTIAPAPTQSPVTADSLPLPPPSKLPAAQKIPDEMDSKSDSSRKYSIDEKDTALLIGRLVQVLESVDSVCKTCASGKGVQHMHFVLQEKALLDPALDVPPAMQQLSCTNCNSDAKLSKCTGCDAAAYCSRSCQITDWPKHRKLCSLSNTPSANSSVSSRSAGMEYSAQMSPNGSLERISPPLTNGTSKNKLLIAAAGDNGHAAIRTAVAAAAVRVAAPKQSDVTDGTTPFRPQTGITRTRIDPDPPSSGRPIAGRPDPVPHKMSPGELMTDLLTMPIGGSCAPPPPKKTALPAPVAEESKRAPVSPVVAEPEKGEPKRKPVSPVVAEPKKEEPEQEKPGRKLTIGERQHGLVVWQDEEDDAMYFLSGDETTIYDKIDPHIQNSKSKKDYVPQVGDYVLAKSTEDKSLYRAEVTGVRGENVAVYFIDYGNSDNVKVTDVRPVPQIIDPVTSSYPPQAVRVKAEDAATTDRMKEAYEEGAELFFMPTKDCGGHYIIKAV